RNDDIYFQSGSNFRVASIAVHFLPECFGSTFFAIPEMKPIRLLLEEARRGIRLTGDLHDRTCRKMEAIPDARGLYRITLLLEMLHDIACSDEKVLLSSLGFVRDHAVDRADKINDIYQYTFNNFTRSVCIEDVARHVHISPHSFCR